MALTLLSGWLGYEEVFELGFQCGVCHCPTFIRLKVVMLKRHTDRVRGVAAVEFALCLPVMVFIALGSMQAGYAILLRQKALYIAESTTIDYSLGNIQESQIRSRAAEFAKDLGIQGATAKLSRHGRDMLRLDVSVPISRNSPVPSLIGLPRTLSSHALAYRSQIARQPQTALPARKSRP